MEGYSVARTLPVRAISIRQPYVELILNKRKRFEYRSQPTRITGPVLIYASLTAADSPSDWRKVQREPGTLPVGKIVGTVEIVGCRWDPVRGAYAYALRNPRRLRRHLTATNQPCPRFWRPRLKRSGT